MGHPGHRTAVVLSLVAASAMLGCDSDTGRRGGAAPAAARTAATATIAIGTPRQTFDGWGAAVTSDTWLDPLADLAGSTPQQLAEVDRLTFSVARINLIRVFTPVWDRPTSADDGRFVLMRRAARYGVRFLLTGGGAPESLQDGGKLKQGAEREYAAELVRVLELAQGASTPFAWVAVGNEVELNPVLRMSAAQAAAVYAELVRLIADRGLRTRLVLGDNAGWAKALDYVREQLAVPGVAAAADALASHPYRDDESPERRAFRALARDSGRKVWMTEWTSGCPRGDCPDDTTIAGALKRFGRIPTDIGDAGASAWFVFRPVSDTRHGADDGLIVRSFAGGRSSYYRSKRFHVLRQFSSAGPAGSRVLDVRQVGTALPAVAFRRGRRVAVVVLNAGGAPVRTRLELGRRKGRLTARQTTATKNFASLRTRRYSGRAVSVTLPPQSATTFYLDR